jgi:hypothetical protein
MIFVLYKRKRARKQKYRRKGDTMTERKGIIEA